MKITLIGPAYPYRGGISHFNSEMARAFLEQKGIEVQVINFHRLYPGFIFPGKTQFDESENTFNVPSERLIDVCNPISWFRTANKINAFKPDLVFFQWWTPLTAIPYLVIAKGLKKASPLLAGLMHNIDPHESIPLSKSLFATFVKKLGLLVVMSRGAESKLLQNFTVAEQNSLNVLTLFHPLYDCFKKAGNCDGKAIAKYLKNSGYTYEELKKTRVVLFFGLIRKYKGLKKLIQALPSLNVKEKTVLLVAGEFYESKEEYLVLIKELGLEKKVVLLDSYIPNEGVSQVMDMADVLVCPYESGEQSGVIAAALANRLPVITMAGKGIGEIIEDGATGLLLKSNEPKNIAEKIEKFYELSENTDFKGHIEKKNSQYSWDNFITKILEKVNGE